LTTSVRQAMRRYSADTTAGRSDNSTIGTIKKKVGEAMETVTGAFKEEGKVGKEFKPSGSVGGAAQKVGGPLDKDGKVGKQFTKDGAVGGTVQEAAEAGQEKAHAKAKEGAAEAEGANRKKAGTY